MEKDPGDGGGDEDFQFPDENGGVDASLREDDGVPAEPEGSIEPRYALDKRGRRCPIDEYGNRIIPGNRRPPGFPTHLWDKMKPEEKDDVAKMVARGYWPGVTVPTTGPLGPSSSTELPRVCATIDANRPHTCQGARECSDEESTPIEFCIWDDEDTTNPTLECEAFYR